MSDTFSFASRLCKFVILLVILLSGGASLYLWWLGRPYHLSCFRGEAVLA